MIEIKCTEEQKEIIINAFCKADVCSSIEMSSEVSSEDCATIACGECYEQNIKWDIQPEPLKPCPFCGGKAVWEKNEDVFWDLLLTSYKIKCSKCFCSPYPNNYSGDKKKLTEIWNRRTTS